MKKHDGNGGVTPFFLYSGARWSEGIDSRPGRFNHRKSDPSAHWKGRWVGTSRSECLGENINHLHLKEIKTRFEGCPACNPVANNDWTLAVPRSHYKQDRQCTCNVTTKRFHETTVAVEKKYYIFLCVCAQV